ncbi:hypothetical protein BDW22DRAFT_1320909 [Trametopsis cervina]|nr:hypothetical protein BDW22DRAFT_1320909 [Trametopsis cervina]
MPAAEYSVHDYRPVEIEDARTRRRGRKGKQRDAPEAIPVAPQMARDPSDKDANKAWWLDVASPTWEDMRTIGKLLHLHPLTLEDILTQEPREKLELFPKLGYYLVVFRAIESEKTRNRRRLMGTLTSHDGRDELREEGIVGDVNVYLVVFREGICSFHFSDISEHADAVRNKILSPQSDTIAMSSDWIAHGIMDSIVDSFFPLLEQVEREMIHLETVMFSDDDLLHPPPDPPAPEQPAKVEEPKESSGSDTVVSHSSSLDIQIEGKDASPQLSEKPTLRAPHHTVHTKFLIPRRRISTFRQAKSVLQKLISMVPRIHVKMNEAQREQLSHNTVHRVARVRKLVTSLSRILAAKSEVVAQVKKRLLMAGESGLAHGTDSDHDVYVYLGDVQDHILTLQQSLAHYERMLSHSHPTYLAHLRLSATKAKTGSDKAIVVLTIVSMAVLVMQAVLGFNSMNVTIPHNFRGGKRFNVFGIVLAISLCVLFLYGCVVRSWWVRSARRRNWS